jgi:hypothetical protein
MKERKVTISAILDDYFIQIKLDPAPVIFRASVRVIYIRGHAFRVEPCKLESFSEFYEFLSLCIPSPVCFIICNTRYGTELIFGL